MVVLQAAAMEEVALGRALARGAARTGQQCGGGEQGKSQGEGEVGAEVDHGKQQKRKEKWGNKLRCKESEGVGCEVDNAQDQPEKRKETGGREGKKAKEAKRGVGGDEVTGERQISSIYTCTHTIKYTNRREHKRIQASCMEPSASCGCPQPGVEQAAPCGAHGWGTGRVCVRAAGGRSARSAVEGRREAPWRGRLSPNGAGHAGTGPVSAPRPDVMQHAPGQRGRPGSERRASGAPHACPARPKCQACYGCCPAITRVSRGMLRTAAVFVREAARLLSAKLCRKSQ